MEPETYRVYLADFDAEEQDAGAPAPVDGATELAP
jgi:hypothetical protein